MVFEITFLRIYFFFFHLLRKQVRLPFIKLKKGNTNIILGTFRKQSCRKKDFFSMKIGFFADDNLGIYLFSQSELVYTYLGSGYHYRL